MEEELMKRKQELEFLIESQRKIKERNGLTEIGLRYLEGLEQAYDMLFPITMAGD